MPMYAYACAMGHETEDVRKFDDRQTPGPVCPVCGQETAYTISGGKAQTFRFKNDSRNKGVNISEV